MKCPKLLKTSLNAFLVLSCSSLFSEAKTGELIYEESLKKNLNSTFEDFEQRLPEEKYLEKLSFNPIKAKFYDLVSKKLLLTKEEKEIYQKNGFVSIDHDQRYSFGSAYYGIYTRDLPVLVTTDSILHALHKSFDLTLMTLEEQNFYPTVTKVMKKLHQELANIAKDKKLKAIDVNLKDVDLYITVTRNLLAGAGAEKGKMDKHGWSDKWHEKVIVSSLFNQDDQVKQILLDVRNLKINTPVDLYGKICKVDFSQYIPRGHYSKSTKLKRYFRAMMWLGRPDSGFQVLPDKTEQSLASILKKKNNKVKYVNLKSLSLDEKKFIHAQRGARNSIILSTLMKSTAMDKEMGNISDFIDVLIGQADNLTQEQIQSSLNHLNIKKLETITSEENVLKYQNHILNEGLGKQEIRSQLIYRDNPDEKAIIPVISQLFGQRFIIDSFVLSNLVYDSIEFKGKAIKRVMPKGLDVMAALGNDLAGRMLKDDMLKYPYAANMMASQDYINALPITKWQETSYNQWLDIIRSIDKHDYNNKFFPEVMKSKAWREKQLQTQLASWSQLRHDTVLYAKQSYTAGTLCFYPKGYIEPYPEVYTKCGELGQQIHSLLQTKLPKNAYNNWMSKFWKSFSQTQFKLAAMAKKELQGLPFTKEEENFIKKTIDQRGGGSGPPSYDGWYANLFLNNEDSYKWEPEIVDVHTNPDDFGKSECLEVGTGDANFIVIAIDNGKDITTYVGPAFTYYEFVQNLNGNNKRLTDEKWGAMLRKGKQPKRPSWINSFQASKKKRVLK